MTNPRDRWWSQDFGQFPQPNPDQQHYGELRFNAFGLINGRLFVCTYTLRLEVYRIISIRKASRQEQRRWLP